MRKIHLSLLAFCGLHLAVVDAAPTDACEGAFALDHVERTEVEVKYLDPDLSVLPADVREALLSGRAHADLPRRGFVLQDYVPATRDNLVRLFDLMNRAGVPFGTPAEQRAFLEPDAARELRLMAKSILVNHVVTSLAQITVKGPGGVAVDQLESPEDLSPARAEALRQIIAVLRPAVHMTVRKLYFEVIHGDHPIEIDIFLGRSGVEGAPIFINGEIEFHGATKAAATAAAEAFRRDPGLRPAYLTDDLTEAVGLKSRDIAAGGAPDHIAAILKRRRAENYAFTRALARQFETWADPSLAKQILYPAVNLPVDLMDPPVFDPRELDAAVAHFREHGFVVLDHVSAEIDRERLVELMDRTVARGPETRRLGFMDLYHDDAFAQLRQNPGLYAAFARIFGTERLWVVFDRVMYWRRDERELPLPPHVDQNPVTHPDFFAAQGMLALRDMHEGTGTLALAPGSQREFERYAAMARPGAGFVEFEGALPWRFKGLRLKAGQIVIWDSRVTHGRTRGEPTGDRYAALITFTPARDDEALRARRLDAFTKGTGVNDHDAGLRATAPPRYDRPLRETEERLSPLGRRLYGVDTWFVR